MGTRKDDVTGGAKALKDISTKLLAALQSQCGPAVKGLERDSEGDLCFFAIENSRGFDDPPIQALAAAIGAVAQELPALQRRVRLEQRDDVARDRHLAQVRAREASAIHMGRSLNKFVGNSVPNFHPTKTSSLKSG